MVCRPVGPRDSSGPKSLRVRGATSANSRSGSSARPTRAYCMVSLWYPIAVEPLARGDQGAPMPWYLSPLVEASDAISSACLARQAFKLLILDEFITERRSSDRRQSRYSGYSLVTCREATRSQKCPCPLTRAGLPGAQVGQLQDAYPKTAASISVAPVCRRPILRTRLLATCSSMAVICTRGKSPDPLPDARRYADAALPNRRLRGSSRNAGSMLPPTR